MNKTKLLAAALLAAMPLAGFATGPTADTEVYLFNYANPDGTGGLKLAWSTDSVNFKSIADNFGFVNSDFGPWNHIGKKMFRPKLTHNANGWQASWDVLKDGSAVAYATSPNLTYWHSQIYIKPNELASHVPADVKPVYAATVKVDRVTREGYVQRVPYSAIEHATRFAESQQLRGRLYGETAAQDPHRFAGLEAVDAKVKVNTTNAKTISDKLIGIFFEDINYAADGGLYAELVQNRDFEYSSEDHGNWNATTAWSLKDGKGSIKVSTENPLHANNAHSLEFSFNTTEGATLLNTGYDGIKIDQGKKYDFSLFARVPAGERGKIKVTLVTPDGRELGSTVVKVSSANWKKQKAVITATGSANDAQLALTPIDWKGNGTVSLDMVSLFPRDTFKGRANGLRADLAQTLADLQPKFVRFPGGCVAHGNGVDNIYDWKGSIGPLESRKSLSNIWGYHQTRGLGYHEYFLFCEDINAEPLPVLAAGVPCQNSGRAAHHSTDALSTYGQQGGIPMEEMDEYIQDVLDLIEYANGDARTTEWGRKRAEAGHPKPFNLKYVGIGNEDMITEVFIERFNKIYDAVTARYPEIQVVGTGGPFYEGTDYVEGWKLAIEKNVPLVDEHYYVAPGWMIYNQDYYDHYDRNHPKVYLGEYAAHLPGRPSNVETALAEALYLTSVERNADVVAMTSYAPLLAKDNHTQWRPDLIYFNNWEVRPTTDYYTQKMYGNNPGIEYLSADVELNNNRRDVSSRIGVSTTRDAAGDYIVKLVNMLPVAVNTAVALENAEIAAQTVATTVLSGKPSDSEAKPVEGTLEIAGNEFNYSMPAYSFTVIRIKSTQQ